MSFPPLFSLSPARLLALAGLLALTPRAAAQPSAPPPPPRDWAEQTTLRDGWEFVRGDLGGVWETLRSRDRALALPVWTVVTLPHCYNARDAVDPDAPYYQGPAWYRTELDIANPHPGGRTLLQFEGSGQNTQVWIGDVRVADHRGGYDEFVVDITDAVAAYRSSPLARLPATECRVTPGRVPLAVRCDNTRDLESLPSDLSDFTRYGGLYRPVHLVYLPAIGLSRVLVTPTRQPDGRWRVAVSARFAVPAAGPAPAPARPTRVSIRISGPDGTPVAEHETEIVPAADLQPVADLDLPHPELWSPASPALYRLEVVATNDSGTSRVGERFGLRWFEFVDHGPFQLNGVRLALHGTHRHEDHAGVGAAMTDATMEAEMRLMKAMGVNFIRLGHYQQSRRILELCDELGILVWEEIPWCRGGLGGDDYRAQARALLRAMIDQHRNHPAVMLWGLGNEIDWPGDFPRFDAAAIRRFVGELHALAHELDPTRLTALRRCEFARDLVDVYSPSIWAGWYRGRYTEYAAVMARERLKVRHLLHAEWGGDSHAGRHAEDPYAPLRAVQATGAADERGLDFSDTGGAARASRDGDWSETYVCDLVDWHLKEQEQMDWFAGSAMWPFKDFATPLRAENPVPRVNQKGAVARDLTPKESYYVYQSYWTTAPMVHLYGHTWPVRWGRPGETREVRVYSNCPTVELWANGVSQGRRQRDARDFPAAGLRWPVPLRDGMNSFRAVGRAADGRTVVDEITVRYEPRAWGPAHRLRLQDFPASTGRIRVQAELLDAAGVVCLDARDVLRFGFAGDGRILDNLGTVGGSRVVQLANGRAWIEAEVPAGAEAVVTASVGGVPTAVLRLHPASAAAAAEAERLRARSRRARFDEIAALERTRILGLATELMAAAPVSLRSAPAPAFALAAGAVPGDYVSMGDYWWPNPDTRDGLPYVQRDGQTNPANFDAHRQLLRTMRDAVATFGAAYLVSGDPAYAQRAAAWLQVFFVDPATRMNPHLRFAQAIPGRAAGRGIGIIDTLHLAEVALATEAIAGAPGLPADTITGVRAWFADYLRWLQTSPFGRDEASALNNHSVAFYLQVAAFARLLGDQAALADARHAFTTVLLPSQLAPDGSFPRELARTKPYGYSIFQLDNVALLTELLSTPADNLWAFRLPDGRSPAQAVAFLAPYLADRDAWPFARDIAHFDSWPVRSPALLLGGYALGRPDYLGVWQALPAASPDAEVRRNQAVTQPLLWVQP